MRYHTGRAPLEAASLGVNLAAEEVAFRCNLVTLHVDGRVFMEDYSDGHITSEEAREIIQGWIRPWARRDAASIPG